MKPGRVVCMRTGRPHKPTRAGAIAARGGLARSDRSMRDHLEREREWGRGWRAFRGWLRERGVMYVTP